MEKQFEAICVFVLMGMLIFPFISSNIIRPVQAADAIISGTVKDSRTNSGLAGAKVTAEAPGSYAWGITGSSVPGQWSLIVDTTKTYDVDAMKYKYDHKRIAGVIGPRDNIIHNLKKTAPISIEFFIAADEEFRLAYTDWKATAKSKLMSGQPWFKDEHDIYFKDKYYYTTWDSNDTHRSCYDDPNSVMTEAKTETGWSGGTHQKSEIMIAFTRQPLTDAFGCADIPGQPNQYPGIIIGDANGDTDQARTVMHEITHTFGMAHHDTTYYCTMANDLSLRIKNWQPSMDDNIELRKSWYRNGGVDIYAEEQSTGNYVNGLFASVYYANGTFIQDGFTPFYVDVTENGTYYMDFSNYGNYYFTNPSSAHPIAGYNVYDWGARVTMSLNDSEEIDVDGIYYNNANPGNYVKITYESKDTSGNAINGMYGGFKDINGNVLSQGFTPYTVGMPKNAYLKVIWNDYGTKVYQYADLSPNNNEELSDDNSPIWGGEQVLTLTGTGPYTDTGRFTP